LQVSLRPLFAQALIYGGGDALAKSGMLLALPVYARVLSPQEFGILTLLLTASTLLVLLLSLGFDTALVRYFFEARSLDEQRVLVSTCVIFYVVLSTIMILPILAAGDRLTERMLGEWRGSEFFRLLLAVIPLTLLGNLCTQILRNQFRARLYAVLNVGGSTLTIGLGIVAVAYFQWGVAGILSAMLISGLVMLPIKLWAISALLRPRFSWVVLSELLQFGLPLTAAGMAYWLLSMSDRILLGALASLEDVGRYGVAATLVGALLLANSAFAQAWWPHAVKAYENSREAAAAHYGRVLTYLLAGFGLSAVAMTAFGPELLRLLAGPSFAPAAAAIAPLCLGIVAYATTQVTHLGISLTKHMRYIALLSWAAALINVILNMIAIPRWGLVGAAAVNAVSYSVLTLGYLVASQRLWPTAYESRRAVIILGATAMFTLFAAQLPDRPLALALPVKLAYLLTYVVSLFAFRALDAREIEAVRSVLRLAPGRMTRVL
jgi:O-antigen/teichoic acid export membrane protein